MPIEMNAALLREAPGELVIEKVTLSDPLPDEVQLKVIGSGLCHSDLTIMEGKIPFPKPTVLGHEAAGIVTSVGAQVSGFSVGDHVITCLSRFCGNCPSCARGRTYLCENRDTLGLRDLVTQPVVTDSSGEPVGVMGGLGAFAEYMTVHHSSIVAIDEGMPLDRAALIGCGVITGFGAATNEAKVAPGETVVVIGCGGIGLNVVQGAALSGASKVIAVDMQASKLELAQQFGATHVVNAAEGDPVKAVRALTAGRGVDHAFEAIGLKPTIEQAVEMASVGGGAYLIGVMPVGHNVEIHGLPFAMSGKRLHGVRMGSGNIREDFPKLVGLYQQGKLLLDELIAERIDLEQVNDGYEAMRSGEQARSVITFDA